MQRLWQQTGYGDYMSRSLAGGLRNWCSSACSQCGTDSCGWILPMLTDFSFSREYSRQMEQKLQIQKQSHEELTEKMDEISRMRHDIETPSALSSCLTPNGKISGDDGIPAGVCIRYNRRGKANLLLLQKHGRRCSDPFLCRRTERRKGFLLNVI